MDRARIGTAGWNIPRAHRDRFPIDGAQLARYAGRLNATEINTSFYRPHAASTYERWAGLVPAGFQFAVKVPRLITHERALAGARDPLRRFLEESAGLGTKRGPLLVQLPPSLAFDARRVGRFLALLRADHEGPVVCEPRHVSWTSEAATRLLINSGLRGWRRIHREPPACRSRRAGRASFTTGCTVRRVHISHRIQLERIAALAASLRSCTVPSWCIFDNTGSGSAAGHAVELTGRLAVRGQPDTAPVAE